MSDEFGCTGCFDPSCEWCLAEAVDLPAYIAATGDLDEEDA